MKVKKIGEIPKPPEPKIVKEMFPVNNLLQTKTSNVESENLGSRDIENANMENTELQQKKILYMFGGIVIIFTSLVLIYFQFINNDDENKIQNSISDINNTQNPPDVSKELQLKEKELELREQKLNTEIEKRETDIQKQNPNVNVNILDGYYQVGSVFCTIRTNRNNGTVKWDKGVGLTTLVADFQGEDVIYMEYDSRGVECGYFYFYDGFYIGDYNRKDGKIFKVTKIR